ncbi:hypothetical protein [Halosegnis marinus]|uniref:hypothetical protein n=1 Tax=Halosegnis marinus TaxID=3034023 RepID=UPI00360FA424
MARLYKYAASSDKSGYYILSGSDEGNATISVTPFGDRLFNRLPYEAGIRNQNRGPRLPSELYWGLFDAGILYTGDEPSSGEPPEAWDDLDEATDVDEDVVGALKDALEELAPSTQTSQQLAATFDFELEEPDTGPTPIWELPESRWADIESFVQAELEDLYAEYVDEGWDLSISFEITEHDGFDKAMLEIIVRNMQGEEYFRHFAYVCPAHGFETIGTVLYSDLTGTFGNTWTPSVM